MGLSIAAPVGPIGILCIRRTLANGMMSGLVSGLGAATADALYGSIAASGLTVIALALSEYQQSIRLAGGLFLLYLAYVTWTSRPSAEATARVAGDLLGCYLSTLFLTLANPMTVMSFAAVFAGLGLGSAGDFLTSGLLVGGVFCGSVLWWLLLAGFTCRLRSRFDSRSMLVVNRLSALLIFGFAVISLLSGSY